MPQVTTFTGEEFEQLYFLAHRVLRDVRNPRRGRFAIAYAFAQTSDNEDLSLMKVADMLRNRDTRVIGLCHGETANGYPGYDVWEKKLYAAYRLCRGNVVRIYAPGNVNTRTEATALVRYMKGRQGDVAVIAPSFHLVRVFMTMVAELQKYHPELRVYPIAADGPWLERVRHSQGVVEDTRAGLLIGELQRIDRYRLPEYGGMPSPAEVLEYLDWRDS